MSASEPGALISALTAETNGVVEFSVCLNAEQAALRAGEADEIAALIPRKTRLALALNVLTAARNEELQRHGFPVDRPGLDAAADACAATAAAAARLLAQAAEAAELNRLNGRLIALHLQTGKDALNALGLVEASGGSTQSLYGNGAQAVDLTTRTGVRIVDSA